MSEIQTAPLPLQRRTEPDPDSGWPVTRLTAGVGHSHHMYFTNEGWWDAGRQLLYAHEDEAGKDLWTADLAAGTRRRITRLGHDCRDLQMWHYAIQSPTRDEVYVWYAARLIAIDLQNGHTRPLWNLPEGMHESCLSVSADGAVVLAVVNEDLTARHGKLDGTSVANVRNLVAEQPLGQLWEVPVAGDEPRLLHEHQGLLGHPNGSPTDPDLLTFCHEGPWLEIDQRIWGLRRSGGEPWPIIPKDPAWGVGHEYWLADGETIGYHCRQRGDDWGHALGFVRYDNSDHLQAPIACPTHHAHAQTRDLVVLDGTRRTGEYLLLIERQGDGFAAPRILARHSSSRGHHRLHVHPRISRDGQQVVWTSDRAGYADVYLSSIPEDLSVLPVYDGPPFMYYWM